MRKFLVLALAAISVSAIAQAPKGGGGFQMTPEMEKQMRAMKEQQMQLMIKELKLTKDQEKKVRAIDAKTEPKLRKLMNEPGDLQSKRPKMMKIVTDSQAELKKVLTKAQWEKYQKMQADQMRRMRGGN